MLYCDFLTGFLGSGKTTLLNSVLSAADSSKFAIIVNEFGEVGLDQLIFNQISSNVYLLDSGCLCCTITHSLRETLLEILHVALHQGRVDLKKVVIESSGLADPLPTLHALMGDSNLKPYFKLGAVVTTVDGMQGTNQINQFHESLRQVLVADYLCITKTDLCSHVEIDKLQLRLNGLNPSATIIDAKKESNIARIFNCTSNEESSTWRSFFKATESSDLNFSISAPKPYTKLSRHTGKATSWSNFIDVKPTWAGVSAWWEIIKFEYGTRLLRMKGLISISEPESNVMIHGVGNFFHSPTPLDRWPDNDKRGRLVCIGIDLDPGFLDASLLALNLQNNYSKPKTLAELSQLLD